MAPLYQHTVWASRGFGWLMALPVLVALPLLGFNFSAATLAVLLLFALPLGVVYWVFRRLDIALWPGGVLTIALAGGWVVRRVQLSQVTHWSVTSPSWLWGWGLRFTGRGWMYRIGPHPALCFHLAGGEELVLATDDVPGLTAALQRLSDAPK